MLVAAAVLEIAPNVLFKSYFESLPAYTQLDGEADAGLIDLKLREAALLLLRVNPEMKDILFDFSEPGKIDLEAFMNKNFHFNVDLTQLRVFTRQEPLRHLNAILKSLFHITPSRWLCSNGGCRKHIYSHQRKR